METEVLKSYLEHGLESRTEGKWDLANHKALEEEVDHHAHGKLRTTKRTKVVSADSHGADLMDHRCLDRAMTETAQTLNSKECVPSLYRSATSEFWHEEQDGVDAVSVAYTSELHGAIEKHSPDACVTLFEDMSQLQWFGINPDLLRLEKLFLPHCVKQRYNSTLPGKRLTHFGGTGLINALASQCTCREAVSP